MHGWDDSEHAALFAVLELLPRLSLSRRELSGQVNEGRLPSEILHKYCPPELFRNPAVNAVEEARKRITGLESQGIQVLTPGDSRYPRRLGGTFDRPLLLFARGFVVSDDDAIAVVGSRQCTSDGEKMAAAVAQGLVELGITVSAGLAEGIDAVAHQEALRMSGRTIAVIATGINRCYPNRHRDLHQSIAENGAVFSQFWPDSPPQKHTFIERNSTTSGYSMATVVVEAGEFSGSRAQARKAIGHGRPVILSTKVAENTQWGQDLQHASDVHVAHSAEEVLKIVQDIRNRPILSDEIFAGRS